MVTRPCLGCGKLTPKTRCPECAAVAAAAKPKPDRRAYERTRKRPSATERGYGHEYRRRRAATLDGATHCVRCGEPFTRDNPATGGHITPLRHLPKGQRRASAATADLQPECRRCNYGWARGS